MARVAIILVMRDAASAIVGRAAELAAIDAFLITARTRFAILTLEGEAGIGKTTIWLEAVRRATDRGARVVQTRPSESEATLSYAALADLFDTVTDETINSLPVPQREAISAALLRAPAPPRGIDERALCAAVLSLLRLLSAQRPLVAAVDDAQWLDSPSARVLSFAVRRLETEPIGVVVTARVGGAASTVRFDMTAEPSRRETMRVGALSVAALHELIKQQTGRSLSRTTLVQVARICGGNPFYALEIAAALPHQYVESGPLPVPDSLTDLVVARVEQLPPASRRALLVAAALSQPTTELVDARSLAAARQAGMVSVHQGRIQFAHPLLASAVYGRAGDLERRSVHRRLATAVTEPEERARHSALGAAEPDAAIAGELEDAAALAKSRGAPGGAAELLELAVGLTPPRDGGKRAARLVAAAASWFDAGDLARAQATIEQSLPGVADAPLRGRALHLLGLIHARRSSFGEAIEVGFQALEAATGDAELRAEVELDLAFFTISVGDLPGAEQHARSAVLAAESAGALGVLGDAIAVVTMAEFVGGRGFDEARIHQARSLEEPNRNRAWQMSPAFIHGSLLLYTGRLDEAVEILDRLHIDTLERGEESPIPFSCFYRAWAYLWRGDLITVGSLAEEARQTAALLDDPAAHAIALATSALAHAMDGSIELARHEASESVRLFQELNWTLGISWPLWAVGTAELSAGNPEAVDAALGPLASAVTTMPGGDPFLGVFIPEEIEALVELGELDRAETLVAWLEARGAEQDRAWVLAAAGRCRGLLRASRGDVEGALTALDGALAHHARCGMPLERARTLLALGRVQRRGAHRGEARATLMEALTTFERVGAPLWAERARGELDRVGRRAAVPDALTPTESRVAHLASSGLANKEIAERAFLTTKAVEANLTRVYRKLGIRSRGGLARALQTSGETRASID